MKLEEMMARTREAEALIPPTPGGPRPGDPVLYQGGGIFYFDRPLPSSDDLVTPQKLKPLWFGDLNITLKPRHHVQGTFS